MKTQQKLPQFNACEQKSLTSFYAFYTRIQKVHPRIWGKISLWISTLPAFGRRVVACRSSAPKRNCLHQTVGSSDLLAFSTFRFSVSILVKVIKWLQKKQKTTRFIDLWINSVWIYHLYDSYHRPYQLFHLSLFYIFLWYTTPETPGHPRSA